MTEDHRPWTLSAESSCGILDQGSSVKHRSLTIAKFTSRDEVERRPNDRRPKTTDRGLLVQKVHVGYLTKEVL